MTSTSKVFNLEPEEVQDGPKGPTHSVIAAASDLMVLIQVLNLAEESENRSVLDAFFLGKALAEALNERIESAVGEFFSTVGRLQAEQQRQVQDLQEEVLERAKIPKEKAAREAMEAQGLVPKSSVVDISVEADGASSTVSSSPKDPL